MNSSPDVYVFPSHVMLRYANDDAEDAHNGVPDAFAHNGPVGTGTGSYQSANGVNTW